MPRGHPRGSNGGGGRRFMELDLAQVERLAASGLNHQQIAMAMGISDSTFYRNKRTSKAFNAAVSRGVGKGLAVVAGALMRNIVGGDSSAQRFYLRSKGGWRDNTDASRDQGTEASPLVIKLVQEDQPKG